MRAITIIAFKFVLLLVVFISLCTLGWEEIVKDRLYHCLQPQPMDFLRPGEWIHGTVAGGTENYGDWIRPGWSIITIWAAWISAVLLSIVCSFLLAIRRWRRSRRYYR